MIVVIAFMLFITTLVANTALYHNKYQCMQDMPGHICAIFAILYVLFLAASVIGCVGYFASMNSFSQFIAFDTVKDNYEKAIIDTLDASVVIDANASLNIEGVASLLDIGIDVENLVNAGIAADQIREARNYLNRITISKQWYSMALKNPFLRIWMAPPPEGMFP